MPLSPSKHSDVLVTGATGFLGGVICNYLRQKHTVYSLARNRESDIRCNLVKEVPTLPPVDIVVHAAGKAHSRPRSKEEKKEFYDVNVTGTQNLLRALDQSEDYPKVFVFISTVAVYGVEEGQNLDEETPLGAQTPYGLSKIRAEKLIQKWGKKHRVNTLILRLPLVVGSNPPGNLGAMIRAIKKGYYIRPGNGNARRSMVLATDVARLIESLSGKTGVYNLTDGYHPSFAEVEDHISKTYNRKFKPAMPQSVMKLMAKAGDYIPLVPFDSYRLQKMQSTLTFSDKLARHQLGWAPTPVLSAKWTE